MKTITIPRKLADDILKIHAAMMGQMTGKSYVGRSCEPVCIIRLAEAMGYPTPDPDLNKWIKPKRKELEQILAENPDVARNIGHLAWLLNQPRAKARK